MLSLTLQLGNEDMVEAGKRFQQVKQRRHDHPGSLGKNAFMLPVIQTFSNLSSEQLRAELSAMCGGEQQLSAALESLPAVSSLSTLIRAAAGARMTAR